MATATTTEVPGSKEPPSDANEARRAANARAAARLLACQPAWSAVRNARDALGLPDRTLLHAGPPLSDPCRPPAPLLSSAVLACLHEGWANDMPTAEWLVRTGNVRLRPAQDFGAVTPLAAVLSPSTALVEISDMATADIQGRRRAWSLLSSGAGPQLRFGSRDEAILPRLAWRDTVLAAELGKALEMGPVPLLQLASAGLAGGDDLHASTTAATAALCDVLLPRLTPLQDLSRVTAPAGDTWDVAGMLRQTPLFFLTLWMAAAHLMLDAAAEDGRDAASTLVVGLAGNGERVGLRLAGAPAVWHCAEATPPEGPRLNELAAAATASPVIGDSGVIDALGCGGQALAYAPAIAALFAPWLGETIAGRADAEAAMIARHPALHGTLAVGLDAAAVPQGHTASRTPIATIAMLDAQGKMGLLGRGIYRPPAALFAAAVAGAATPEQECAGAMTGMGRNRG